MLTFIAFVLTIAGCVNWLLIGLLQYDFVAGIFGYQGSVFSRLVYIVIGAAAAFLVVKLFIDKGSIHVWGAKKKKQREQKLEREAYSNIEASKEERRRRESGYDERSRYDDFYDEKRLERRRDDDKHSLFDD